MGDIRGHAFFGDPLLHRGVHEPEFAVEDRGAGFPGVDVAEFLGGGSHLVLGDHGGDAVGGGVHVCGGWGGVS